MPFKLPIIGCTSYRKQISQQSPIEVYGLMPSYSEAISKAGGALIQIPLGLSEEQLTTIVERVDGLLLPGGGDVEPGVYNGRHHDTLWGIDPERDRTEFFLTRLAVDQSKPLLAICRGIQVFNVAMGGTLWEDIASMVPEAIVHRAPVGLPRNHLQHTVTVKPESKLAACLGQHESWVNSLHHQAIRELAPALTVTATSEDGLVEAAEVLGHPFALGVQWHPENLVADDLAMLGLFRGLVRAAAG